MKGCGLLRGAQAGDGRPSPQGYPARRAAKRLLFEAERHGESVGRDPNRIGEIGSRALAHNRCDPTARLGC